MKRTTLSLLALGGCMFGGGTRDVRPTEIRAEVVGIRIAALDTTTRAKIERGELWPGAPESLVYIARGEPRLWWNTQINNQPCRVLVHHGKDPATATSAVTACSGVVVQTAAIEPALPCWRLSDVGPRIAASLDYFEQRPLATQWQIVIGLLHRGQAERDVEIAFGKPYNRGYDEREDGRHFDQLAFLDRSGDSYGLEVTLTSGKVVAWKMPVERRLTPAAQQRRLDAMEGRISNKLAGMEQRLHKHMDDMEGRIMTKLDEMEKLSIKQHQETVQLFGEVMAKQDQMMGALTAMPAAMPAASTTTSSSIGTSVTTTSSVTGTQPGTTTAMTASSPKPTIPSKPARPDPLLVRDRCFQSCQSEYASLKQSCSRRFDDSTCKGEHQCKVALGMQYMECAHSKHFTQCTRKCDGAIPRA